MQNLHDLPNSVKLETPSFWFWFKAGVGFAIGAAAVSVVCYASFMLLVYSFAMALLHGRPH